MELKPLRTYVIDPLEDPIPRETEPVWEVEAPAEVTERAAEPEEALLR